MVPLYSTYGHVIREVLCRDHVDQALDEVFGFVEAVDETHSKASFRELELDGMVLWVVSEDWPLSVGLALLMATTEQSLDFPQRGVLRQWCWDKACAEGGEEQAKKALAGL